MAFGRGSSDLLSVGMHDDAPGERAPARARFGQQVPGVVLMRQTIRVVWARVMSMFGR